jgi:hypothetical protein
MSKVLKKIATYITLFMANTEKRVAHVAQEQVVRDSQLE